MYIATHIFTYLLICLSIYLPIYLFIHHSTCPSTYLPVCVAKLSIAAELVMSYGFYIVFVSICWDSFCVGSARHKAYVYTGQHKQTNKQTLGYVYMPRLWLLCTVTRTAFIVLTVTGVLIWIVCTQPTASVNFGLGQLARGPVNGIEHCWRDSAEQAIPLCYS